MVLPRGAPSLGKRHSERARPSAGSYILLAPGRVSTVDMESAPGGTAPPLSDTREWAQMLCNTEPQPVSHSAAAGRERGHILHLPPSLCPVFPLRAHLFCSLLSGQKSVFWESQNVATPLKPFVVWGRSSALTSRRQRCSSLGGSRVHTRASAGPGRAFSGTGERRVLTLLVLSPFFRSFHSCFPVPGAPMSRVPLPSRALPSEGQLFQADL